MNQYKAVIFDMDGVLTETSEEHFKAWGLLAESLGYTLDDTVKDQVRGISRMASLEIVLAAGGKADAFSLAEKETFATQKNDLYLELIHGFTPANLGHGVKDLLDYLKSKNVRMALASASKNAPFLLEAMNIDTYFEEVVNPAEIANGKPAPDIFLKAADQLGLAPSACIGVEDAYAGIESIHAAGMISVGIGNQDILTNCDNVYPDVAIALDYFKTIFGQ